jgi:Protein of unknown function (DUF3500)
MWRPGRKSALLLAASLLLSWVAFAQTDRVARFPAMSRAAEEKGLAEPFKGITTNGEVVKGLFALHSTGVSTAPVRTAAEKFLAALSEEQRRRTLFPADDLEWRKWMNQSFYVRQGVGFDEMSAAQREAAFGLMRASLSAKGLKLSRDIMKLNHTLGELNHDNFVEYGEWLYWITVMGTPSATEPWGWQMDGHHLIVNYFVLGEQVVMTPSFFGSEPARATSGKYRGTSIMQEEQAAGLAFMKALTQEQRTAATLRTSKDGNDNLTEAFKDNVVLDYAGMPVRTLSDAQKRQLLALMGLYIHNMRDDQARVRIDEVNAHMDETYFAWIGGTESDSVYYYRIHSPVVLIEFDHQKPANLRHLYPDAPYRDHIHAVMRTPNGNDYGKDLLRQHYLQHPH